MRKWWWVSMFILNAVCILFAGDKIKITHGPYFQNIGTESAVMVWTTDRPAVSWVEMTPSTGEHFYAKEHGRIFESPLGNKLVGTLHKITLPNLSPATAYDVRAFSREVVKLENNKTYYGDTASTKVYKKDPIKLTTLGKKYESFTFAVLNDMHGNNSRIENLLSKKRGFEKRFSDTERRYGFQYGKPKADV